MVAGLSPRSTCSVDEAVDILVADRSQRLLADGGGELLQVKALILPGVGGGIAQRLAQLTTTAEFPPSMKRPPRGSVESVLESILRTGGRHLAPSPDMNGGIYNRSTLNRFVSADSIIPEPGSSQAFNRYSYVYNSPTLYVDPSGHCGGDPDNHNPFDDNGDILLDCTYGNFNAMSIEQRIAGMLAFMQMRTELHDWFNNIVGIMGMAIVTSVWQSLAVGCRW